MRTLFLSVLLVSLVGCAHEHAQRVVKEPGFYVPTTGTVRAQTNPYFVLAGDDPELIVLRGEKMAYGATSYGEYSAYTAYTSDAQAVGIRGSGYGYRYRYMVQSGISAP